MTTWIHGWLRRGWGNVTNVENKDLFKRLYETIQLRPVGTVKFQHVRGHSGEPGNEMADRLAVRGADMRPPHSK